MKLKRISHCLLKKLHVNTVKVSYGELALLSSSF